VAEGVKNPSRSRIWVADLGERPLLRGAEGEEVRDVLAGAPPGEGGSRASGRAERAHEPLLDDRGDESPSRVKRRRVAKPRAAAAIGLSCA
jgi:hypothetical protein